MNGKTAFSPSVSPLVLLSQSLANKFRPMPGTGRSRGPRYRFWLCSTCDVQVARRLTRRVYHLSCPRPQPRRESRPHFPISLSSNSESSRQRARVQPHAKASPTLCHPRLTFRTDLPGQALNRGIRLAIRRLDYGTGSRDKPADSGCTLVRRV